MGKEPIKRVSLANGLTLEFFDQSKHVAADRWLISVRACVTIPLDGLAGGPNGLSADQANPLKAAFGAHGVFWIYAVVCLLGYLYIFKNLPETKGKSLEQIERELVD